MTDLSGIARRLRLSDDQIRLAADLIQQGFHPSFIERYRSDESGGLTPEVLWSLKLEIDRSQRLAAAKQRSQEQLPKDAVLDDEANKGLDRAVSETEVDVVMRAWRARRNLAQTAERDAQVQEFLEHLIAYEGDAKPVAEIAQEKYSLGAEESAQLVEQAQRLMGLILQCDARLNHSLRKIIQKKARVSIDYLETSSRPEKSDDKHAAEPGDETAITCTEALESAPETPGTQEPETGVAPSVSPASETVESAATPVSSPEQDKQEDAAADSPAAETSEKEASSPVPESEAATTEVSSDASSEAEAECEASSDEPQLTFTTPDEGKSKGDDAKKTEIKSQSKLTPRQRRRRWLSTMLQPMKSLKESISKLTAYQLLMLGRGRRSQIVRVNLQYEPSELLTAARDTFVAESHKLASWFSTAVDGIWGSGLQAKVEADVLSSLEENAQDKLLETATDQLRASLMRRPIRGHVILLVDTIGPKSSAVAVVGPDGRVLHTDEVICSAQPDAVNQNVAQLGEIIHRFQVTLVTLTNGPARRFLLLTVRELMKHSGGELRWTMADRGGAEAYAAGRSALRELPAHNRRMRAAIWVARSQIDPLGELLKIDVNRIRLGSYQRELPQDPLRNLIRDTITQCVSYRGVDTHRANVESLQYVPGVEEGQAQQIATLAGNRNLTTRENLVADVSDWPEHQRRQAIGFLRLYGSEQKLDATLVHPEDYKLAERLVSNTELESPADSPEGWELPPFELTVAAETEATLVAETVSADAAPESAEGPATEAGAAEGSTEVELNSADSDLAAAPIEADAAEPASEETQAEEPATSEETAESPSEEATSGSEEPADTETISGEASPAEAEVVSEEQPTADGDKTDKVSSQAEYPEDVLAFRREAADSPAKLDTEKYAKSWQVGRAKLNWIASCLQDPFGDPRLDGPPVPMLTEVPTLPTLKPDICLWAVVVGVADFGAFVELAPDCSGLIHISQLSKNYVEDPHQVVQVGDLMMVWVISCDEKKNKVALTTLSPEERANQREENANNRRRRENSGDRPQGKRRGGGSDGKRSFIGKGRDGKGQGGKGQGGRDARRGRGRDGGGRRRAERKQSKPVVVQSKKPKAPISDAMKEGEEPLRSFSDLMQFYEAKRTDDVPPPKSEERRPESESVATSQPAEHEEQAEGQTPTDES